MYSLRDGQEIPRLVSLLGFVLQTKNNTFVLIGLSKKPKEA